MLVGELSRDELMAPLNLRDRKSFRERYLAPALADGLIEMTQPAKPNSPGQRYQLTEIGRIQGSTSYAPGPASKGSKR